MAIGESLRAQVSKIVPTWLANVPGLRRLFSIVWAVAFAGDELREQAIQGQYAAYPGVGTPTALPYLAASRGLLQGPTEPDAAFALRLIAFRQTAKQMGSVKGRLEQIQAFLCGQGSLGAGVYPVVVGVDRAGNTVTLGADRSVTFGSMAWDWDELGGWVDRFGYETPATVEGFVSDVWVLVQDPYTHYTSFTDANWLAAWNSGDQTIDSLCSQAVVSGIKAILQQWKGAHIYVRSVVFCADPTTFTPTGYYGNASRNIATIQTPVRDVANSYWQIQGDG